MIPNPCSIELFASTPIDLQLSVTILLFSSMPSAMLSGIFIPSSFNCETISDRLPSSALCSCINSSRAFICTSGFLSSRALANSDADSMPHAANMFFSSSFFKDVPLDRLSSISSKAACVSGDLSANASIMPCGASMPHCLNILDKAAFSCSAFAFSSVVACSASCPIASTASCVTPGAPCSTAAFISAYFSLIASSCFSSDSFVAVSAVRKCSWIFARATSICAESLLSRAAPRPS